MEHKRAQKHYEYDKNKYIILNIFSVYKGTWYMTDMEPKSKKKNKSAEMNGQAFEKDKKKKTPNPQHTQS